MIRSACVHVNHYNCHFQLLCENFNGFKHMFHENCYYYEFKCRLHFSLIVIFYWTYYTISIKGGEFGPNTHVKRHQKHGKYIENIPFPLCFNWCEPSETVNFTGIMKSDQRWSAMTYNDRVLATWVSLAPGACYTLLQATLLTQDQDEDSLLSLLPLCMQITPCTRAEIQALHAERRTKSVQFQSVRIVKSSS